MLKDKHGHPVCPEARLQGRRGLVPMGVGPEHIRSACQFALHQRGADLTPQGAFAYASALGMLLWVLPFAEQAVAMGHPGGRERPDSSDAAARAWALSYRVVEAANLICRGSR